MVAHVEAFEPRFDVTRGIVGTALGHGAMHTQLRPLELRLVLLAFQHRLDGAMHQQVWITTDRRGEVRISLVAQTEVTHILRCIHRLTQ